MPCVIAAVAMVQEFGTWKWYGIAFGYQMVLAWGPPSWSTRSAACWDWGSDMGTMDMIIAGVILAGAFWLLYHSIWKKKGHCPGGCGSGGCCDKK